ncbi:MAG: MBL fold metallo-hydrolase [Thermoplasmatota archaeon]
MERTKLVLLGTGNPNPDPLSSGPASAVIVDDRAFIIDAGPGVVRRAWGAYQKGIGPLRADRLEYLFLTHLHSDHTVGLPDLVLTPWVMGRRGHLKIFGPPGTKRMCGHILEAYREDITIRSKGLEGANEEGFHVNIREIKEGVVHDDSGVRVSAFRVNHGSWEHAFGFRFETPDGVIVISGDCSPTEESLDHYRGADILLHEVYSAKGLRGRPKGWQKYHRRSHTSSEEIARIASEVRPGLLVLYHQLLWGSSPEEVLEEIGEIYHGEVRYGKDLDIY